MVRAIPGPVFSIAAFMGGVSLRDDGVQFQLLGCALGMIAIFLPSALLVLFFFPIWYNLKKYAVVVGIMVASTIYMMRDISITEIKTISALNIGVIASTWLLLAYTRIPSPVIVLICLLLGAVL